MHIIVCVDDKNGILFNKRRLSSDRVLCQRILSQTAGKRLWMNAYSAKLFTGADICVDDAFLEKAGAEDICFIENADITPFVSGIHAVTVYRWNRTYPSDVKFPAALFENRWKLERREDFSGYSHEVITEERYTL